MAYFMATARTMRPNQTTWKLAIVAPNVNSISGIAMPPRSDVVANTHSGTAASVSSTASPAATAYGNGVRSSAMGLAFPDQIRTPSVKCSVAVTVKKTIPSSRPAAANAKRQMEIPRLPLLGNIIGARNVRRDRPASGNATRPMIIAPRIMKMAASATSIASAAGDPSVASVVKIRHGAPTRLTRSVTCRVSKWNPPLTHRYPSPEIANTGARMGRSARTMVPREAITANPVQ